MRPTQTSFLYKGHLLIAATLALWLVGCAEKEQDVHPSIPDPPNANSIVITDELSLKENLDVPGEDLQAMLFPKESRPKDEIEALEEAKKAERRAAVALALKKKAEEEERAEESSNSKEKEVAGIKYEVEEPEAEEDADTLLTGEVLEDPSEDAFLSGYGTEKVKPAQEPESEDVASASEEEQREVPLEKIKVKESFKNLPKRNIMRHTSLNKSKKSAQSPVSFDSALIP